MPLRTETQSLFPKWELPYLDTHPVPYRYEEPCSNRKNRKNHHEHSYKKDKYVYIIDPKIGRVKLKIDHFLSIFTGYSLIKTEVSDYKLKIKF